MLYNLEMFETKYQFAVNRSVGYESVVRHSHNFIEIVYVESGSAVQSLDDEVMDLTAGDMFIIAGSQQHSISPKCDEKDFSIINIIFDKLFVDIDFSVFSKCEVIHFPAGSRMNYYFKNALDFYEMKIGAFDLRIKGLIYQIIADFLDEQNGAFNTKTKEKSRAYISLATAYIHEHFNEKIRLQDISDYVGVTSSYLQKLFKRECDTTVIEYLLRTRIEKACKSLIETDDTVSDICYDVGFSDIKNFYCYFKKVFNISPIEYRNLHRKKTGKI